MQVRGVFVQLQPLILQIKNDHARRRRNKIDESMSITILNTNNTEASTCELNGQFIHSQLLIDVFVRMKVIETDKNELITLCKQYYSGNEYQLDIISQFEKDYEADHALWWYTRDSFLYRLLNKALRVQNIDLLFLFRFFIRDIQVRLDQLKCLSVVSVYRSQLLSDKELTMLKNSVGRLISMNSFISTTRNRELALFMLGDSEVPSHNLKRVLFEIEADPQQAGSKYFADITCESSFIDEEEVLIMFGSIFRIKKVYCDKNGIWIVQIVLCTNSDEELKVIYNYLKKEYGGGDEETDLLCAGTVIRRMGHSDQAEKYFLRLLSQLPHDHHYLSSCYYNLAIVANDKGQYDTSLELHHRSLDIKKRIFPQNDPAVGESYNSIGHVYREKFQYAQAYEFYNMALEIWEKSLGIEHPKVAISYQNIGIVLGKQKKYPAERRHHEKALAIRKKLLPAEHPELADSYHYIGNTYFSEGVYNTALVSFEKSLEIYRASLPSQHPSIARTHSRIGLIYTKQRKFDDALVHYKQAASIYSSVLPPGHHKTLEVQKEIELILTRRSGSASSASFRRKNDKNK